jgi:hypothetical protein
VAKHDAAQAPIVFMEQIGRLYSAVKGETDYPALVANYHGGGRVVYFPGLAGEFYGRYRMMEYQKLLSDAVRWVHEEPLILDADCPPTVEIELWRQNDPRRTMVHLVNNTGDMQRPITEIIPVREVKVRLRLPYEAKRVRTLGTCQDLPFTRGDEGIEFSVYDLGLYEVVVVE